MEMKDFFISYNKNDLDFAKWIAWILEEKGFSTIIQEWDFKAGANFIIEMQKASENANRTIAVLSDNYLNAEFTQPEWAQAFAQDPTGAKRKLIPIRVDTCELKGMLAQIIYVDLVGKNENDAEEELLKGISLERLKPTEKPKFPGSYKSIEKPLFPNDINPK